MAAEAAEKWTEGGEVVKKIASEQDSLILSSSECGGATTTGSIGSSGGGDSALSVSSDANSEEYSSDSGKGGSDTTVTPPDSINGTESTETVTTQEPLYAPCTAYTPYSKSLGEVLPNLPMAYDFDIPQYLVGRLIGKQGCFVNRIKWEARANLVIKPHRSNNKYIKTCAVVGFGADIEEAIRLIRERFPLSKYAKFSMEQTNPQQSVAASSFSFIPNNGLNLIEGVINDVSVSCVMDLDHIFLQQPTHPTFPALSRMHESLNTVYERPEGTPEMLRPFNAGVICVTKIGSADWVRAEVVLVHTDVKDQVTARLVDIGGYVQVPVDELRQIRADFITMPFQATECRLANVAPVNEKEGWSAEAVNFFKIICQGHILQAHVVGYCSRDGTTLINLYKPNGTANHILINEQLVTHNYAKWIDELNHQYVYTPDDAAYTGDVDQLSQNMGDWVTLTPGVAPVVPTEQMTNLDITANVFVPSATTIPSVDEVQSGNANEPSSEELSSSPTILSWADEMTRHDLEQESNNNHSVSSGSTTEDLKVKKKGEDENARRKTKTKSKTKSK